MSRRTTLLACLVIAFSWLITGSPPLAYAQGGGQVISGGATSAAIPFPGAPTGSCNATQNAVDTTTGNYYSCNNTVWLKVGPGAAGSAAFNTVTSGTNTGQTLTVGNSSTLATSGSGVINANQCSGTSCVTGSSLTSGKLVTGNGSSAVTVGDLSGDVTTSGSTATTVGKINGGSVPASAGVLGSNSSSQPVAATAHGIAGPLACADSSGSGAAQSCTTSPSFSPARGDCVLYTTTTANTGALTLNVNASAADPVQKWMGTAVASGDVPANHPQLTCFDGANWQLMTIGNAPSGGSPALSSITSATVGHSITNGNFGQIWDWALTGAASQGMFFGENSPSTGGTLDSQALMVVSTASGSTAEPLQVANALSGAQTLSALLVNPIWNTTGVVDAAVKVNVTNTASGAASKLLDLQVGGTTEANVDKAGNASFAGAVNTNGGTNLCGTSSPCISGVEGATAPTPTAGDDFIHMNSAAHCPEISANGSALECPLLINGTPSTGKPVQFNAQLGSGSMYDVTTATGLGISSVLNCSDTSGSGTAQVCNTSPTFTPAANSCMFYNTTTTNTGALTINVNSLGVKSAVKWQGAALVAGDIQAGKTVTACYDGTNWDLQDIGNAPSGGAGPVLYMRGFCGSTAGSGTTGVPLVGLGGNASNGTCASAGGTPGAVITRSCTVKNLFVAASNGGVNASDGVFTVLKNTTAQTTTCTTGTGTTCNDTTHTFSAIAGDKITVQLATQASSTLASIDVSVECQ